MNRYIKIGSCSALDWRLLDKIVSTGKPVIISVGGLSGSEIDKVVKYLESYNIIFALLHCISLYPTDDNELELNQLDVLKNKYPNKIIGFSTHENPSNYDAIKVAYAKGARIFERHISIKNDLYKINDYSSTPEQIYKWLVAWRKTKEMSGEKYKIPDKLLNRQKIGLNELKRGVIAKSKIKKGDKLSIYNTELKFPLEKGQLSAFDWSDDLFSDKDYVVGEMINMITEKRVVQNNYETILNNILKDFTCSIKNINFSIPKNIKIYLSFHYGIENFYDNGCVQIYVFENEFYSKKLLFLFPGQNNPIHFHKNKTETFSIVKGSVKIYNEYEEITLREGEYFEIKPGYKHGFLSNGITLIEEISTHDKGNDSFYIDEKISNLDINERKVLISHLI